MIKNILDDLNYVNNITEDQLIMVAEVVIKGYRNNVELRRDLIRAYLEFKGNNCYLNRVQLQRLLVSVIHFKGGK